MGTQYITAGRGDHVTFPAGTNDPQCFDDIAAEQAEQTAINHIWATISGNDLPINKQALDQRDEARLKLADHLIRYLCDVEVTEMMEAYLSHDKEKLFVCFGEILGSAIEGLADMEDAHA